MAQFFQFEADFVESLRCIPMQVRMKLDTCGVKLKLSQWHQFNQQDRQQLVDQPCETSAEIATYREFLHRLIFDRTQTVATDLEIDPTPAWLDPSEIPRSVQEQAASGGAVITSEQWASLTPIQRFALIKLSRSGHENNNFFPALQEFHLA